MAKRGRKRRPGPRYPSGELKRIPELAPNPCVYVLGPKRSLGPCKIGYATWSTDRLHDIQIGSWEPLEIYHMQVVDDISKAKKLERMCHEALKDKRIRGEWFDVCPHDAKSTLREQNFFLDAENKT